ncbi:uncharacterized protein VTP21DRAFT_8434 [Calcarisporiella thermophila]|uniref:uncharacterized protein n=1 Tax=Calcarisporiella thermophila TaxID=911321 RepID=UPI0037426B8E
MASKKAFNILEVLEESEQTEEKAPTDIPTPSPHHCYPFFSFNYKSECPSYALFISLVTLYIFFYILLKTTTRLIFSNPEGFHALLAAITWLTAKAAEKTGWYSSRNPTRKEWWGIKGVALIYAVMTCLPEKIDYLFYGTLRNNMIEGLIPMFTFGISRLVFKEQQPRFIYLALVLLAVGGMFLSSNFYFVYKLGYMAQNEPLSFIFTVFLMSCFTSLYALRDILINRVINGPLNLHPLEILSHSAPFILLLSILLNPSLITLNLFRVNTFITLIASIGIATMGLLNTLVIVVLNMMGGALSVSIAGNLPDALVGLIAVVLAFVRIDGNVLHFVGAIMTNIGALISMKIICSRRE